MSDNEELLDPQDYEDLDEDYLDDDAPPDPWVGRLTLVAGVLVVAILSVVAYGVYITTRDFQGPRTAAERRLRMAEAAVAQRPEEFSVMMELAWAQIEAQKYGDAEDTVSKALELEPDRTTPYLAQGDVEFERGDRGAALKWYKNGLKFAEKVPAAVAAGFKKKGVTPPRPYYQDGSSELAYAAAAIYEDRKEYDLAADMLELAVKFNPQDASSWSKLGDVRLKLDEKKSAEKAYRQALRFIPDHRPALDGLKKLGVKP